MGLPLTQHDRHSYEAGRSSISSELRLLPRWSIAAALFAFVSVLYIFWVIVPAHRHHQLPFAPRLFFALTWSELAAFYMLMVGYISRDTARRGMQARAWVVICLMLPGGVGAVLYFLLREPLISLCPACSSKVQQSYHFCPQCAYQLSASCQRCYTSMGLTDRFCIECGYDRAHEKTPQRLYAFRDEE